MKEFMSFNPQVSIIIPVYNGSNYLREAIDSALAQTYKNIEVIVVNDGSNDGGKTEAIALSYGDRIRYFYKKNGGCASALNYGIQHMTGDYFSWLSHDDVYYPGKIEKQIDYLSKIDDRSTILYGGYELIDKNSLSIGFVRPDARYDEQKLNIPLFPLLRGLIHGCSMLISRDCFETEGLFGETLRTTQDYALWFKMFRRYRVRFIPDILIKSRVHPQQGTHSVPNHLEECNQLWIGFMDALTSDEMRLLEGSQYLFYKRTAEFLRETPYKAAYQHCLNLSAETLNNKKISVVIPFHNRVNWTVEAIESVRGQTHRNLDIIVVDDGSTDDISLIHGQVSQDERVRYIYQASSGPASARNRGIGLAAGKYIAFLDSDDIFQPEKLERQLQVMEEKRCSFSHTSYQRITADGVLLEVVDSGSFSGHVFPQIIICCPIATPTVMVRKEVLSDRRFRVDYEIGEDVCLWIELAYSYDLAGISEPLTKVRLTSTTAAIDPDKHIVGIGNIVHFLINHHVFRRCYQEIRTLLVVLADLHEARHKALDNEKVSPEKKSHRLLLKSGSASRDGSSDGNYPLLVFKAIVPKPIKNFLKKILIRLNLRPYA